MVTLGFILIGLDNVLRGGKQKSALALMVPNFKFSENLNDMTIINVNLLTVIKQKSKTKVIFQNCFYLFPF